MGELVVSEFISLDGVMEAPDTWNLPFANAEMEDQILIDLRASGALLFGRVTYTTMAAAWPSRTGAIAERFNTLPKYLVSSTVAHPAWTPTSVIALDDVAAVKQRTTGSVMVWGSGRLVRALMERDLVDAYHVYVHPIVLGRGTRLFHEPRHLTLRASRTFSTGVVALAYAVTRSTARPS